MSMPRNANVAFYPKRLTTDSLGHCRERAHCKVELAGFEPAFEMQPFELMDVNPDIGASVSSRSTSGGNSLRRPASTTQKLKVRCDVRGSNDKCSLRSEAVRSRMARTGPCSCSAFGVGSMRNATRTNNGSSKNLRS